jgi:hypothetical protein
MTKEEFVNQLERAALTMPGLPVSSALVCTLCDQLKVGEPPWWKGVCRAWEKRKFVAWTEAWGLFLSCVHFEALSDSKNPLVPYFPSCGGTDEADPSRALLKFLSELPPTFFEHLKTGHRRPYIELRAPLWIDPARMFFQSRSLPFYLVEVNAGGGLNLAADIIVPQKGFDSELLAARIGLDPVPLLLEDIVERRWLTAALLPDQMPLIQALDRAIEVVLEKSRKEAAFIQLAQCSPELAAKFIAKNIPADDKDVGILVLNMGATARMSDKEYEDYKKGMAATMKPWEDRALWVEFESVRGEMYSTTYQLRVFRCMEGELRLYVMASFDFNAKATLFDQEDSERFLKV